jgi:type IV pilus assembly protein PilM
MRLESLLEKIAGRRQDAIGIDIGSGSIKMAEVVMRSGKPYLKKMALADVPTSTMQDGMIVDEAQLVDTLQRMASRNGVVGRQVAVALGGRSLFIREVMLPRMSTGELRQAIRWDLDKYVPFSPDQVYFDFWVTGPGQTALEDRVLLVAVPRDVADTLARVLKKSGLKPIAIDIEPLAIQRTIPEATDCMVIDSGASVSQVTLFLGGSPVFTRNIPIGGNRFTETMMEGFDISRDEAELLKQRGADFFNEATTAANREVVSEQLDRIVGELAGEVRRTLEYYQVQNRHVSISQIYITGGAAKYKLLPEKMTQILELPVALHDPLAMLDLPTSFNLKYLRGVGPQMSVAVGLAMRSIE